MLSMEESLKVYEDLLKGKTSKDKKPVMRELCKADLFFLITQILNVKIAIHPWTYERIKEVEAEPDNRLDLWSRGHLKSTIITLGLTIQDILKDPNITVGIFSHTKQEALKFLAQIKTALESNKLLKSLFPEILYEKPDTQSPSWSLVRGLTVKRNTSVKECTVEAWGIVDSPATGQHYDLMVMDDLTTEEGVRTAEQLQKTLEGFQASIHLGKPGVKKRYIGTRYHFNDIYAYMIDKNLAVSRIRPGFTEDFAPLFWSKEYLDEYVKALTPYQVACQLLLNPIVASEQSFDVTDLRYYHNEDVYPNLGYYNRYILVDPANSKNRRNDFTVMLVVGLGKDKNYYIIDAYRDKLDIFERAELLSELHKKYHPLRTGYEKYSMQVDVDYIKEYNDKNNYRFEVTPLAGTMNKIDRISKLGALFKENRIYIPKPDSISHIRKFDKKPYLPIREFIDELSTFPLSLHDDMLDALSRVLADEMNVRFPGEGNTRPGYKVTKFKEYNILGLR